MLTYDAVSKKYHVVFKIVYAKFQLNSKSLCKKCNIGVSSTLPQQLQVQNTLVVIELIEVIKPSDTMNYEPFLKHCIIQTILGILLLFIFVWNKIFVQKTLCKVIRNQGFFS